MGCFKLVPTSVDVNIFSTIVLLTLITNCDGGALLTTQHTHFCLILCLILRGGRVALVSPNMRWDMLPWCIGGDGLACGCKIVQNATKYGLVLRNPCIPGGPQGGQNQKWLPHPCLLGGPKEGGNAMSPLHSRGSPNKGGQNQKWLPHPYLLRGPKEGGSATSLTPTFSGVPNAKRGEKIRSGCLSPTFSGAQKRA